MRNEQGASASADRAGGLRPEPVAQSQPEALIPCALEDAIIAAAYAHKGQVDKGGHPYILHPLRVMQAVGTNDEKIAAVLHDTVEDCGFELDEIRNNFGAAVANAVDALTRRVGESYTGFILRCGENDIARKVKLADLADNMRLDRLGREPTVEDARRQRKYEEARGLLFSLSTLAYAAKRDSDTRPKDGDAKQGSTSE